MLGRCKFKLTLNLVVTFIVTSRKPSDYITMLRLLTHARISVRGLFKE